MTKFKNKLKCTKSRNMLNEVRDVTKTTQKEKGFKRP